MYKYAKKRLFKAVVELVKGTNPQLIGKGVKYPKINLHTWIENASIDKEQGVREISFIVEAYSNSSYDEAVNAADLIAEKLCENTLQADGLEIISIVPDGSEEIEEQDNNNIVIYRQLNRLIATIKMR